MKKVILIVLIVFACNVMSQSTVQKISNVDAPRQNNNNIFGSAPTGPLLVDQPPNQTNGVFADVDCQNCGTGVQILADDFVLASAQDLGQFVIWTGYFPGNTPLMPDVYTVSIHADAGGIPGAVVFTESNVASTKVDTGLDLFGVDEYMSTLTLASPVNLAAGTYWLEIHNDSTGSAESVFWEEGDLDAVSGVDGTVFATAFPVVTWTNTAAQNFAFQIYGPAIPPVPPAPIPAINWYGLLLLIMLGGFFSRKVYMKNT